MNEFGRRVLAVVRAIPFGRVLTYGDVATLAGTPRAARAVGNVLRGTKWRADAVPWQRVINAKGQISFRGETDRALLQRHLLEIEGVTFDRRGVTDLSAFRWDGDGAPRFFDQPIADPYAPPDDWIDDGDV